VIKPSSSGRRQATSRRSPRPKRGRRDETARAATKRRSSTTDSSTRTALLDAAEALMLEEGYAAVSSRRVAERAGATAALVYYYFDTMDGLFVELFRRGAERGLERQVAALDSPQPLWALWETLHDHINNVRTMEFFALANHRKAIRSEIVNYSAEYRRMQLDILAPVLAAYGLQVDTWPPVTLILTMGSLSLLLLIEQGFGFDMGHAEMVAVVERQIRELEGERWTDHPALAPRRSS
jgi:AcrR family transcriptional regulator